MSAFFVGSSMVIVSLYLLYIILFHYRKRDEKKLDFEYAALSGYIIIQFITGFFLIYSDTQNKTSDLLWLDFRKSLKYGGLFFIFLGIIFLYYKSKIIEILIQKNIFFEIKSDSRYLFYGLIFILSGIALFVLL